MWRRVYFEEWKFDGKPQEKKNLCAFSQRNPKHVITKPWRKENGTISQRHEKKIMIIWQQTTTMTMTTNTHSRNLKPNDTLQECAHRRKRTTTAPFSAKIDSVCETEFLCTAHTAHKYNIKIITSFHWNGACTNCTIHHSFWNRRRALPQFYFSVSYCRKKTHSTEQ